MKACRPMWLRALQRRCWLPLVAFGAFVLAAACADGPRSPVMPRPVLSVAASQAPPPISGRYDFSHGLERDAMAAAGSRYTLTAGAFLLVWGNDVQHRGTYTQDGDALRFTFALAPGVPAAGTAAVTWPAQGLSVRYGAALKGVGFEDAFYVRAR